MDLCLSVRGIADGAGLLSLTALTLTGCGESTPEHSETEEDMWTAMEETDEVTAAVQGAVDGSAAERDISRGEERTIQVIRADDTVQREASSPADALEAAGTPGGEQIDVESLCSELEGQWAETQSTGGSFPVTEAELQAMLLDHVSI